MHLEIPQSLWAAGVEQQVLPGQVEADVVDVLGRSTCRAGGGTAGTDGEDREVLP